MSAINVVILAAGEQKRFPADFIPKQLLKLSNGKTIIGNTVDMLLARGIVPEIWTANEKIISEFGAYCTIPSSKDYYCCTAASAFYSVYQKGRTIILLGDVVFTENAIDKILATKTKTMFFVGCNNQEIFALASDFGDSMLSSIATIIIKYHAEKTEGKLWHVYRHKNNMQLKPNKHAINSNDTTILDDCIDIDSLEEWEEYNK